MINILLEQTRTEMEVAVSAFKEYLSKVRTGRANVSMLKGVMVDFYGTPTPIDQTAQISSPEPQQLVIKPYDASQVAAIVAGINKADLGLNSIAEANLIRINVPSLTEEVRKDLVKKAGKELENFKVRVRNARRDANEKIKKSSEIAEDIKKDGENSVQKLTDEFITKLDNLAKEKEKDLMTI